MFNVTQHVDVFTKIQPLVCFSFSPKNTPSHRLSTTVLFIHSAKCAV